MPYWFPSQGGNSNVTSVIEGIVLTISFIAGGIIFLLNVPMLFVIQAFALPMHKLPMDGLPLIIFLTSLWITALRQARQQKASEVISDQP